MADGKGDGEMRVCELIEWLNKCDPLDIVGVIIEGHKEPVEIEHVGRVKLLGYVGIHLGKNEIR
jgi:hypothetical protein